MDHTSTPDQTWTSSNRDPSRLISEHTLARSSLICTVQQLMSMKMTADLMCTEPEMSAAAFSSSASSSAAVYASSKLQDDERRLQILLDQEDRFVPSGGGSLRHERLAGEQERMRLLETMFNVSFTLLVQ